VRFLSGDTTDLQVQLGGQMAEAAEAMEFERAAALRDRIRALTNVQSSQGINPAACGRPMSSRSIMEGGQACVQVFFIRANQNWGNKDYYPRVGPDIDPPEVLEAFIGQFYDQKDPPRQLILSHPIDNDDLMADALSQKLGRKVEIIVPQRGEKAELVNGALRNARESLARQMAEGQAQTKLLQGLAEAFDLDAPPRRIEVYDNSHIQGTNAVGAMIVAGPEGFVKSQYRKFNIRGDEPDPRRRFRDDERGPDAAVQRLLKEDPDRESEAWPDLLLIDGGAGQVSAVKEIMDDLGVEDVPFIGVAKGIDRDQGKEEFHRPGTERFCPQPQRPGSLFRPAHARRGAPLRHRHAPRRNAPRRFRRRRWTIFPASARRAKRALLAHFGSAKAVSRANLADLKAVEGVNEGLAQKIYDYFHERG
jgi:excinuclease ABC subunit C